MSKRRLSRRQAVLLLGGATVTLGACGGSASSPTAPPAPASTSGDKTGVISANHGHVAVITSAQLGAGGALTLDIKGTSNHPHTVVLSEGDVVQIRNGARLSKVSSNDDGHTHSVSFN